MNTLAIGDLVMRPKLLGIIQHIGVIVGLNSVLHNTPEKGEHLSSLQEFAGGETVWGTRVGAEPVSVLSRVQKILTSPRAYDALNRNCEHTASEVTTGKATSSTVTWIAIAFLVGVALWLYKRAR